MIVCSTCNLEKSLDSFYKRNRKSDKYRSECIECGKSKAVEFDKQNPGSRKERLSKWRVENKEHFAKVKKVWASKNKDKIKAATTARLLKDPDYYNKRNRHYYKNNKSYMLWKSRKYKSDVKQALPPWANIKAIADIYRTCTEISKNTGVKHHVDHIVPLKGKTVCGLHVENNLRVITAEENFSKSAKLIEELLCQN